MLEFFIIENIMQQGLPFQLTDSGMDTNCYIVIDFRRMLGIGTVEEFRELGANGCDLAFDRIAY